MTDQPNTPQRRGADSIREQVAAAITEDIRALVLASTPTPEQAHARAAEIARTIAARATDMALDAVESDTEVRVLRRAASAMRAMAEDSPYVQLSGQVSDDWGNTCGDIDHAYGDRLDCWAENPKEELP